jgi:uncharacterized protein YerC
MVSKEKQYAYEILEYFFEDDIMLKRFFEYFDDFNLVIDYQIYKQNTVKKMIMNGVPDTDIAKITGVAYGTVWRTKERLLKAGLLEHANNKKGS